MDDKQYNSYIYLLDQAELRARHMLRQRKWTFSTPISETGQEYRDTWNSIGRAFFEYFLPLPGNARLEFVRWAAVGGECLIAIGKNSYTGKKLCVKIARKKFNLKDQEIEVEKKTGIFSKEKEIEIIQNEYRLRLIRGLDNQRKAHRMIAKSHFDGVANVQPVRFVHRTCPVYAVLEWIQGDTLEDFVSRNVAVKKTQNPGGYKKVAFVFWRILRLFQRLHQHTIIHRDVKPENFIIDNKDIPHCLDFVLGKSMVAPEAENLTVQGTKMGDVRYSPPEQILYARADLATYRSDVYSLGWILRFCLTRLHPPKNIHDKRLRTKEVLDLPPVFRDIFIEATHEEIDARPDIDDFLTTIEEIFRSEGIYFDLGYQDEDPEQTVVLPEEHQAKEIKALREEIEILRSGMFKILEKLDNFGRCCLAETVENTEFPTDTR